MRFHVVFGAALIAGLAGCASNYSPNTYSSTAVQQANPVDQGVIVGARPVAVSADTTVGAVTGAAAGGVAGSQVGGGVTSAFGAIGGGLIGGVAGSAAEHIEGDAQAFEYIVRKMNGDLISVTQQDKVALAVGTHVLVIAGKQARIVPDYTGQSATAKTEIVVAPPVVPPPVIRPAVEVPPVPPPPVMAQGDAAVATQPPVVPQSVPPGTAPIQAAPLQAAPLQSPSAGAAQAQSSAPQSPGPGLAPTPLGPPAQPATRSP